MNETINKLKNAQRVLTGELGRTPTEADIAKYMNLPVEKVRDIMVYSLDTISLETPIGDEESFFDRS